VSLSSVFASVYPASKAVDGIYLPSEFGVDEIANLVHTNQELSPWIQVDLIINYFVEAVKVWDRSESPSQGELLK